MSLVRVSDELRIDLAQAAFLSRGTPNRLQQLQKKVCCHFTMQQLKWNEFVIVMHAKDEKSRKHARSLLFEQLKVKFPRLFEPFKKEHSTQTFERFNELPLEIKQMIV
jgi:hypothetical protein